MHDPDVLVARIPKLLTIWHHEPKGADSGTVCKRASRWKWHIHHWQPSFIPWQRFKAKYLTKCDWCGERKDGCWFSYMSTDKVWHETCQSASGAAKSCTCNEPVCQYGNYGPCDRCGNYRQWNVTQQQIDIKLIYKRVPEGERPSDDIARKAKAVRERSNGKT